MMKLALSDMKDILTCFSCDLVFAMALNVLLADFFPCALACYCIMVIFLILHLSVHAGTDKERDHMHATPNTEIVRSLKGHLF